MLEFDIWTIAFSIINILVLFLFLKKFLFGRIQNIMDQRAAAAKIEENEKELLTLEQQAPALKAKMDADQRAHDVFAAVFFKN